MREATSLVCRTGPTSATLSAVTQPRVLARIGVRGGDGGVRDQRTAGQSPKEVGTETQKGKEDREERHRE